jgi:hypothetical protein
MSHSALHYAECCSYAECPYAECRYGECRGAVILTSSSFHLFQLLEKDRKRCCFFVKSYKTLFPVIYSF